jgi:hypothetical protein
MRNAGNTVYDAINMLGHKVGIEEYKYLLYTNPLAIVLSRIFEAPPPFLFIANCSPLPSTLPLLIPACLCLPSFS